MNDKSFVSSLDLSRIARDAWNNEKVISEKDHTIGGLILIWKALHQLCLNAKQRYEDEIIDIENTYSESVAREKLSALRSEHDQLIKKFREKYSEQVDRVFDEKISEVDRLISKTGDPDLISLIQILSLREEISDREWKAVVAKVTASHDYQATRLLSELGKRFNRDFADPFDPDGRIEELETAREQLLSLAGSLDKEEKDLGYMAMVITGEYEKPTTLQLQYDRLDSAIGTAVPEKTASMIDRLKEAAEIARANNDNTTANAITRFIYDKAVYVEDKQVISEYCKEEAEKLISKALNPDNSGTTHDYKNIVNHKG